MLPIGSDRDPRIALPHLPHHVSAGHAGPGSVHTHMQPGTGLTRLVRVRTCGRYPGQPVDLRRPPRDGRLPGRLLRRVVDGQVAPNGRQQSQHLLLADLHRSCQPLMRRPVCADRLDQGCPAQHETSRLRAAQCLAAGEQRQIRTSLSEGPQVLDRRKLRRRVNDHGYPASVRDAHGLGKIKRSGRQVAARDP